jgi:hypothetical protein
MTRLLLIALSLSALSACDEDAPAAAVADTAADTGTGATTTTTTTQAVPQVHVSEGGCVHGAIMEIDLGTESPLSYQVEVHYATGVWEPMLPDVAHRSSAVGEDPAMQQYESPLYRVGSVLTFTCGYEWERPEGPTIEGEGAGQAVGWRVSWITL